MRDAPLLCFRFPWRGTIRAGYDGVEASSAPLWSSSIPSTSPPCRLMRRLDFHGSTEYGEWRTSRCYFYHGRRILYPKLRSCSNCQQVRIWWQPFRSSATYLSPLKSHCQMRERDASWHPPPSKTMCWGLPLLLLEWNKIMHVQD